MKKYIQGMRLGQRFWIAVFLVGLTGIQIDAQEETPLIRARVSLEHLTSNVMGSQLKATVKAKLDVSYEGIPDVTLKFYRGEESDENLLGSAVTDAKGVAILPVTESGDTASSRGTTLYIVSLTDSPKFGDATQELEIAPSTLSVEATEEDSLHVLAISLTAPDSTGTNAGVPETPVNIYVQRMFSLLPISSGIETTDESGQIHFQFPQDIPGDKEGKLKVLVKVEDNDTYGNLVYELQPAWGIPLKIDTKTVRRELWSSRANAPIYLIVLVNVIILGVWGVIVDVIRQVFLIRKYGIKNN